MFSLKKLYRLLRNKRGRGERAPPLTEASAAVERDLGVVISRIRLPSGGEVIIVEKRIDHDD